MESISYIDEVISFEDDEQGSCKNALISLKEKYPNKQIGYSGHEFGLLTTFATIPLGATWIERHITMDKNMWGSDHSSSVQPEGLVKLMRGFKELEEAIKYEPQPRLLFEGEKKKRDSLRKV